MALRPCLDCSTLTPSGTSRKGTRCPECRSRQGAERRARRPDRQSYAETQRRRQAVADHIAQFGPRCPGAPERGHKSHPSIDLTADHLIPVAAGGREDGPLRVLCRSENSKRGARE